MKKRMFFVLLATLLLAVTMVAMASAGGDNAAETSSSAVYWWWGDLAGSSNIVRNDNGISGSLSTSLANDAVDMDGLAYTLWIIVFNNPAACGTNPCTGADLGNPAVMPDALYGGGNVTGGSETITIAYHRKAGDNRGSIAHIAGLPLDADGESFGLKYPRMAEIHYVLRSHGEKTSEGMPDQINSLMGGCENNYMQPMGAGHLKVGPGDCQDHQFAIHE